MSVTANEIDTQESVQTDAKGTNTYTRAFQVLADPEKLTITTAKGSCGISHGDAHPEDSDALVVGISASRVNIYEVTVVFTYSDNRELTADSPTPATNVPLEPVWSGNGARFTRFVTEDVNGEPLLNGAGDPFPPFETQDGGLRLNLTVWRTLASFDELNDIANLMWKVNNAQWGRVNQFEAEEALMVDASFQTIFIGANVPIVQIDYTAEIKLGGWNPVKFQNKGFNFIPAGANPVVGGAFNAVKRPFRGDKGELLAEPQLLKPNGNPATTAADSFAVEYDLYQQASFPVN